MANPAVSVITPVYNVEAFLPQCLDSLRAQTLEDVEFICLNDGSTDGSLEILQQYAERDLRFKIIDKPNEGYGATMNRGLDEARGEYIAIIESDDFAEPKMLAKLYKAAKKADADLAKCNHFDFFDGEDHKWNNFKGMPWKTAFDPATKPRIICSIPTIWTGLYKRSWLEAEGIRFRETPGAAFQDTGFTMKCWFAAHRCVLLRKALLHYRMDNPNSSVKTSDKALIVCDELESAEEFLRERPERYDAFIQWFQVDKLGKYRWNYERVSPELKVQFIERMQDEFYAALYADETNAELFGPENWECLTELLCSTPEEYAQKHPVTM